LPNTSGAAAEGRFERPDFVYHADQDAYLCPAGKWLTYHYTNEEAGKKLRNYWTNTCESCAIKHRCTPSKERRIRRWEHETILERVQQRLDADPDKIPLRSKPVEHPFGTIKAWMGATHFKMRTLKHVATEMALHVLAYNMMRVIAILGVPGLVRAMTREGDVDRAESHAHRSQAGQGASGAENRYPAAEFSSVTQRWPNFT
jgi:hypothetical protein